MGFLDSLFPETLEKIQKRAAKVEYENLKLQAKIKLNASLRRQKELQEELARSEAALANPVLDNTQAS